VYLNIQNGTICPGPHLQAAFHHYGTRPALNFSDMEGAAGTLIAIVEQACSPLP
jgi:hypothetical protein